MTIHLINCIIYALNCSVGWQVFFVVNLDLLKKWSYFCTCLSKARKAVSLVSFSKDVRKKKTNFYRHEHFSKESNIFSQNIFFLGLQKKFKIEPPYWTEMTFVFLNYPRSLKATYSACTDVTGYLSLNFNRSYPG